ncbi:MAG: 4-diphosphocytidyl-2-C-methyl-D-erythritol kinase [Sulfurimonas sp.]|jgi:4-diphosphocytidyl-2-C-methyl-D-erythritol kinase|uniref:4-(cytidine 5'-diphospho)-2-C-methyl-D-erythritol kinase n=1 Tax=Sulfurimonas sp. TaxID=2022749 RepID=UPI0039E67277
MGGFEGGDEGGFWDVDSIATLIDKKNDNKSKNTKKEKLYIETSDSGYSIKAHAKVNIFSKVTGYNEGKPTILTRCMRVEDLYDSISFVPCKCNTFTIEGCDEILLESNSIYKAYKVLCDFTADSEIEDFFNEHKVVVSKVIPYQAGLGGASSDASAFIRLTKEVCNLILSTEELVKIGSSIGSELAFFIYNYPSANISGFGEIVEPFEEEPLGFEFYTPDIKCDKTLVSKIVKKHSLTKISSSSFSDWEKLDSKNILELSSDPVYLNDFYAAALFTYPELKKESKKGWLFSTCSFFRVLK